MHENIQLGDLAIALSKKPIKNIHLCVHPPHGHVTLAVPLHTRTEVARAYAVSNLAWIRAQQHKLQAQARETPRRFVTRESHYVWGRRYLMTVEHQDTKPRVVLSNKRITLIVRPGSSVEKRAEVMHEWHKSLLHAVVPPLIQRWEQKLKVSVSGYFLQRMKTKWGSCNHAEGNIRLNTELVKSPRICWSTSSCMKWSI